MPINVNDLDSLVVVRISELTQTFTDTDINTNSLGIIQIGNDTGKIAYGDLKTWFLDDSNLTGEPVGTTPLPGNNSTRLATTEFVQTEISGLGLNPAEQGVFGTVKTDQTDPNPTVYLSTTVDNLLSTKADTANTYTETEVDNLLADKADTANTYTEAEVDNLLSTKADTANTYTEAEVDNLLADKADNTDLDLKADKSDTYTESEVDNIVSLAVDNAVNTAKDELYPVGTIYCNGTSSVNPASLLSMPWSTWARFAEGRFIVSIDTNDTDFNTLGNQGGEKEHALTTSEMPSHQHDTGGGSQSDWFVLADGNVVQRDVDTGNGATGIDGESAILSGRRDTGLTGGNNAHNNLPPYETGYYWIRTA